jgi:hypothetical protein
MRIKQREGVQVIEERPITRPTDVISCSGVTLPCCLIGWVSYFLWELCWRGPRPRPARNRFG